MKPLRSVRASLLFGIGRIVLLVAVALVASLGIGRSQGAPPSAAPQAIATQAYIYGYPLVTMEMTKRVMTNTEVPKGTHAPLGQFAHMRAFSDASVRDVTAPNADTLYSSAWLDLSKEPYVLSLPDMEGRFYVFQMLDGWTNVFADPSQRTTGNKAQKYAIVGPGWHGQLPKDVKELRSPTNMAWILGRTYSTGTVDDYKAVHALQDKMALVPLSAYGKPYTPPKGNVDLITDMNTPVRDQVDRMDTGLFFRTLTAAMKDNPPARADQPTVEKMKSIGIIPGQDFRLANLDPAVGKALKDVPQNAQREIEEKGKTAFKTVNGWEYSTELGSYGTNYPVRALTAAVGLGANLPKDAVYATSMASADGKPYIGANSYVLHFAKGQEPPAEAFWSVTMYDPQFFFAQNSQNRYSLSTRDKLKKNSDGSVDIYIQNKSPGADKEANWLPAPADKFVLMMRIYWPKEKPPTILDGSWKPPAVHQVAPAVGGGPQPQQPQQQQQQQQQHPQQKPPTP
jgi:hypothetical protein